MNPDIIARTEAFRRLRRLSGMRRAEIAKATGLTVGSVRIYSAPSAPGKAPTWQAIEALRQEAIKRAKEAVAKAEDTLFRTEIELQRLERMELPPSPVEGKSALKPAAAVAEGQPKASRRNFPDLRSSSRPGKALQISPCPSTPSAAGPAQI